MDKQAVQIPRITIVTGHYGSGKTNVAINLAIQMRDQGLRVALVDLDIVNPYFRSADFADLARRHDIEQRDERNVAIRRRAQAVAGEALQWAVIVAAWISVGLGAPLWVTLAAVGVFVAKSVLELVLMARYQREM